MPQLHGIINKLPHNRRMFCRNELYHAKSFNLACKLRRPRLACTLTWSGCFLREPLDTVKHASQQYSRGLDEAIMRLYGYTFITKTRLYNFDPLQPHFYIVKVWDLQGYTLFFLSLLKNIDYGYSLEPPRRGGSNAYPQSMFWAEIWKISEFLSENFPFFLL